MLENQRLLQKFERKNNPGTKDMPTWNFQKGAGKGNGDVKVTKPPVNGP